MRLHQRLDARRRDVEARGDRRDLVGAGDGDAVAQLAGAELLDALLQRLEPARQPAHDRIGAGRDGDEEHDQNDRQPGAARQARRQQRPGRRWRRQPAAALLAGRPGAGPGRAGATRAAAELAQAGPHRPQRAAVVELERERPAESLGGAAQKGIGGADALAAGGVERERHAQALRPVAQRGGLHVGRRVGAGQRVLEQLGPRAEPLVDDLLGAHPLLVEVALDDPAGDDREQQQHDDHRRVDAQVQALHAAASSASCFLANT